MGDWTPGRRPGTDVWTGMLGREPPEFGGGADVTTVVGIGPSPGRGRQISELDPEGIGRSAGGWGRGICLGF